MNYVLCGYYSYYFVIKLFRGIKPVDVLFDFHLKLSLNNKLLIPKLFQI